MSGEGGIKDLRARVASIEAGGAGAGGGGGSAATWGSITGTLSAQTDLAAALAGKATSAQGALADSALQSGALIPWTDVTGKPTFFSGAYADLTGVPASFTPSSHTHAQADVTGLVSDLSGKQPTLVSGTNIKTINGSTILGSGDLVIAGGGSAASAFGYTAMAPAVGVFISNALNAAALSTQVGVANRTVIAPFVPAYNVTIDQVGISVSTLLAASTAKVVIYARDANGRPTTVLRESAAISCAAAGTVFTAITPLTLTVGEEYWIGVRTSSTQTLRALGVGATAILSYTNAATPVAQGSLILTETFANAAATWVYAASQHSNILPPLILMRVA